jgi:hypothetical protein
MPIRGKLGHSLRENERLTKGAAARRLNYGGSNRTQSMNNALSNASIERQPLLERAKREFATEVQ